MKSRILIILLLVFQFGYSQFAVKNYSNASSDELPNVKQIVDWIQFHQVDNVFPLLSKTAIVDRTYLNIESSYLVAEFPRDKIEYNQHTGVKDDRNIVWYERNFYKISKSKLKPRYQIYITVEFLNGSYRILDLSFGKKKKINTSQYDKN